MHTGHAPRRSATGDTALAWAITAMGEVSGRLGRIKPKDRAQAFTVISEAVWWVTIVDATLVRYHPEIYDKTMAALPECERQITEGTFAGLRFVRNQMGYHADPADFVQPDGAGKAVATWTWKPADCLGLDTLPPRSQEWEASRHQAYQERLAGHLVGETFRRTTSFLRNAADGVTPADGGEIPRPL